MVVPYEMAVREVIETTQTIAQVAKKHGIHKSTLAKHVRSYLNIQTVDDVVRWCDNKWVRDTRKIISPKNAETLHIWNAILEQTDFLPPSASLRERLYFIKHNTVDHPRCECGNTVSWSKTNHRFNQFCSSTCSAVIQHSNNKRIATNLAIRGVPHPYLSPTCRAKRDETMKQRYGDTSFNRSQVAPDAMKILNDKQRLSELYQLHQSTFSIATTLNVSQSYVSSSMDRLGIDAKQSGSAFESDIRLFITEELGVDCYRDRKIIHPREIDIYIPSHHIGIECDGIFWHSERHKHPKYHLDKTVACSQANIRLVHIFENEYLNKLDIVKSRISSMLGGNKSVGARSCELREVPFRDAKAFFDQTHIQGGCNAMSTILGLYHDDILVACMCFARSRFSKTTDFELVRYSSALYTNVIGGASKLFAHFCKMHPTATVVSYSDVRWNSGALYQNLGFVFSHNSNPNYFYFKEGHQDTLLSRLQFQKHKLSKTLAVYDSAKTEYENMRANGYDRIWDCGNTVWVYTPKPRPQKRC